MEVDVRENIGRLIKDLTETGEWVLDAQKLKVNSISVFAVYLHVNNMKWRKRTWNPYVNDLMLLYKSRSSLPWRNWERSMHRYVMTAEWMVDPSQ